MFLTFSVSPMTPCQIHQFVSMNFVITIIKAADMRLHRFEDRLNLFALPSYG